MGFIILLLMQQLLSQGSAAKIPDVRGIWLTEALLIVLVIDHTIADNVA